MQQVSETNEAKKAKARNAIKCSVRQESKCSLPVLCDRSESVEMWIGVLMLCIQVASKFKTELVPSGTYWDLKE